MPWVRVALPPQATIDGFVAAMRQRARWLLDENMDPALADTLRAMRWKTTTAREAGLAGHDDDDVVAYAWREDRVILTKNVHFLDDRRVPPHRNPGVVVLPDEGEDFDAFVSAMGMVLAIVGPTRKLWRGTKIAIDRGGVITVALREFDTGKMTRTRLRFNDAGDLEEWVDDSGS
jgi:hypothetical protein